MKKFVLFILAFSPLIGLAQEKQNFGITFHGFVKSDLFFDSRQTVDVREGHFLLYPQNENLDPDGKDINAKSSFNLLSIQSRLQGFITGPDVLGAASSAYIEGEFFGTSNADINGFRLRHAFLKLQWTKTQVLVGQYWHPLFVTTCYPGTVSFNTGAPFQPFTRNPQIRITQNFGKFNAILTALSQLDFQSTGPSGSSPKYLRNTMIPALNLRFEFETEDKEAGNAILAGVSANYKTLQPTLMTDAGYATDSKVSSLSLAAYLKLQWKPITVRLYGFYGEDAANLTMLGGYALKELTDSIKGFFSYTPVKTQSVWIDVQSNGKTWQVGVFGGYTKNLGTKDAMVLPTPFSYSNMTIYSRGSNIDFAYRASARLIYNNGKFRLAPELEYTVAAYAKDNRSYDANGKITDSKSIGNWRVLVGFYYFF